MCANCSNNNLMGTNNSNGVGLFIENGNMPVLGTFSSEMPTNVLGNNSTSCGCSNTCNCNGCANNNTCSCNCNGNNNSCNNNLGNNNTATLGANVTSNNLQRNLRNFIGRRCTCEFNICGTCFKRTGVLSCVGNDFITIAGANNSNCMLCNTDGLSFVTIHNCNG